MKTRAALSLIVIVSFVVVDLDAPNAFSQATKRAAVDFGFTASDWPWWRGPERNGIAHPDQSPPIDWSETRNVTWKTDIPGKGHGSCIVVGHRVFVQTSEDATQSRLLLCLNRETGKIDWQKELHSGGSSPGKHNKKSSFASNTPASDGERVFVNFLSDGAAWTTALDFDGNQIWQTRLTDYMIHQGYGSSPCVYGSLVIVSADTRIGGAVLGLDRRTGEKVWKHKRPKLPNYPSPVIHRIDGKDRLFLTGCEMVTCLEPLTGKLLWDVGGATTECVTTTVTDGTHIFSSGGYPKNHMAAMRADGTGKVTWENTVRVYVPSMIVRGKLLFVVADAGVAGCYESETGKELWRGRLNGTFSSSPVLVDNRIYATNESGMTFVFTARPDKFELLAKNRLGDTAFATPTIADSRIYIRVARLQGGKRQESVYCIADRANSVSE